MTALNKKQPVRMCIACRSGKPKQELIRIVRTKEGVLSVDETGKAPGRGTYVCKDGACIEKARKIFPKVMRCEMDDAVYETLMGIAHGHGK
ncbi:RNase P modulator RnpM [Christensenella intestinihominis]|uniref:RNase P modulator RnpM n=1 Tax=Christensenella intestinihominis TaxID=1851429 RepID=UPI000834276A|nr:YlxR family protein [Christensenella intestinihominis]